MEALGTGLPPLAKIRGAAPGTNNHAYSHKSQKKQQCAPLSPTSAVLVWLSTYVYSLSAEHCFKLRNNAISDERVRDCALT